MRILITGAGGQLAHDLKLAFADDEVVGRDRSGLDVADPKRVAQVLDEVRPQVVVNTAAYNLVDAAEADPAPAIAANAYAPSLLAEACADRGVRLMHFSTDYVFSGAGGRDTPYLETDSPDPQGVYARTKHVGEIGVVVKHPGHVAVRTCGLYGFKGSRGKGGNFVETMLRLGRERDELSVVDDQHCTPSFTVDVAAAAVQLVKALPADRGGVFHLTNAGATTWHDFAAEIFRLAQVDVKLTPTTTAAYGAAAPRPRYSVLADTRLAEFGVPPLRPWRDALADYLRRRR